MWSPKLELFPIKIGLVSKINYFQLGRRTRLCQLLTGSWELYEAVPFLLFSLLYPFHGVLGGTEGRQTMCCFGQPVEHPQIMLKNLSVAIFATIFSITLPSAIAWWVRDHLLPLGGELTLYRWLYIYISNITCAERYEPEYSAEKMYFQVQPVWPYATSLKQISFKASTIWASLQNYLF